MLFIEFNIQINKKELRRIRLKLRKKTIIRTAAFYKKVYKQRGKNDILYSSKWLTEEKTEGLKIEAFD